VAHYTQGGGDPVKAIDRYHDRLLFLHLKDVEPVPPAAGADPARSYRFVELGRGRVDLPGVFAALKKAGFKGWAVVELDAVPDKTCTPKDSGQISKSYLEKQAFRIEDGGRA
jgi:inosose dehydratase